jgi:hypothetical protein
LILMVSNHVEATAIFGVGSKSTWRANIKP